MSASRTVHRWSGAELRELREKYRNILKFLVSNDLYVSTLCTLDDLFRLGRKEKRKCECWESLFSLTGFFSCMVSYTCRFVSALAEVVPATEADMFAGTAVHVYETISKGRVLSVIRALVEQEFLLNANQPATIMRGNCVASKIQTAYSRDIGQDYLRKVLGGIVKRIVQESEDNGMDFTIDPLKVSADKLARNKKYLLAYSAYLLGAHAPPPILPSYPLAHTEII